MNENESKSKRAEDPMQTRFDGDLHWKECLAALNETYTLSVRECCRILMCSRGWVQQYVRPHVHYIYLKSPYNIRAFWNDEERLKEGVWLNRKEFDELVRGNMTCTRQTIAVPVEALIHPQYIDAFQEFYRDTWAAYDVAMQNYRDGVKGAKRPLKHQFQESIDAILESMLSDAGKIVYGKDVARPDYTKRSATPSVPSTTPSFDLAELRAVHDEKDYGDTDEMVYRKFFSKGCYKLTLQIPDADGVLGNKVFYLYPRDDETIRLYDGESVMPVLVNYGRYLEAFGS